MVVKEDGDFPVIEPNEVQYIDVAKVGKYVPMLRQMYIDKIKKEAGL